LFTWGENDDGQLGDGSTVDRNIPYQIPSLQDVVAIACGYDHVLALLSDSSLVAWGDNASDSSAMEQ
jgi:alpha-tubulin suppressor-like RCC1 family protein